MKNLIIIIALAAVAAAAPMPCEGEVVRRQITDAQIQQVFQQCVREVGSQGGAAVARCVGNRLGRRDATDAIERRQSDEEIQEAFENCIALLGQEDPGQVALCVGQALGTVPSKMKASTQ